MEKKILKILVSPLAKGAYFAQYLDVARSELQIHFPNTDIRHTKIGAMDFFTMDMQDISLPAILKLSFVQGVFCESETGGLIPFSIQPDFLLPEALVFGAKYQGKTNELVTQLAINLGLFFCSTKQKQKTLLDPMAGKGTTLLWGMRYGLNVTGIEQDTDAPPALHRHIKKQTKLHRIKHSHDKGSVGKKNKDGAGEFINYEMEGQRLRLISGDSRNTPELLREQRFDLIISDITLRHKI